MPDIRYQPKGGMCVACRHRERDCSQLPFHAMPQIASERCVVIVRCTNYEARNAK